MAGTINSLIPTTFIMSASGGIFRIETEPNVYPKTIVAIGIAAGPIKSTGIIITEGI